MREKIRAVPVWAWLAVLLAAGVGALAFHRYARDESDTNWTMPPGSIAPESAEMPIAPAQHGSGSPASCSPAFRSRAYPGSLASADFSVVVG